MSGLDRFTGGRYHGSSPVPGRWGGDRPSHVQEESTGTSDSTSTSESSADSYSGGGSEGESGIIPVFFLGSGILFALGGFSWDWEILEFIFPILGLVGAILGAVMILVLGGVLGFVTVPLQVIGTILLVGKFARGWNIPGFWIVVCLIVTILSSFINMALSDGF